MPSIESNLHSIADSLKIIANYLTATKDVQTATPVQVAAPVAPAPVAAPAPVVVAAVAPTPVVAAPAPVMPAAPVFTDAVPTPPVTAVSAAPVTAAAFPSKQAMMDFVIASYRELGPEKGARIQGVLESIGYKNINDVSEAQWGQLKAGIEGLK